jgi:hypothetical protein
VGYSISLWGFSSFTECTDCLSFEEVSQNWNVSYTSEHTTLGQGLSLADINNDGFDDLTYGGIVGEPIHIFESTGDSLVVSNITSIDLTPYHNKCLLWVDYDNDGDLDLSANGFASTHRLYRNDGNENFTDVTASSGFFISSTLLSFAGAWADYNRDGFLDFYASNRLSSGESFNKLLQNNGDGSFTDVTDIAMVADPLGIGFATLFHRLRPRRMA